MAGSQVNNYSEGDSNATEIMTTLDNQRKGFNALSLTNFENTSKPAIAAGSVIEVNNSLYKFDTEETITGSPSDGDVYIKIIPTSITAEFTNTAPTWSDSKQGWYGTGAAANHRYVGGLTLSGSGTIYSLKYKYLTINSLSFQVYYNSIQLAYLDELNVGVMNIGSLNMYAYGEQVLFTLAASETKEFYLKKPAKLYAKSTAGSISDDFSLYVGLSTYTVLNSGVFTGGSGPLPLYTATEDGRYTAPLLPGRYKFACTGDAATRTIYAIYVEGIDDITNTSYYYEAI